MTVFTGATLTTAVRSSLRALAILSCALLPATGSAQERWFQVEVSIFTNENESDRNEEFWLPGSKPLAFPSSMRRLQSLMDILTIDALLPVQDMTPAADTLISQESSLTNLQLQREQEATERAQRIARIGPIPATTASGFRFFNLERDSFIQLPSSQSDFQQTNRVLRQSPEHRLMFHGVWRQPMLDPGEAIPIFVSGGERYGDYQELMGSLGVRFNQNRDRIVVDADLWLSEFSTLPAGENGWQLPLPPQEFRMISASATQDTFEYYPTRVFHMEQSREMRSTEFHYLDHPAMGIVVLIEPYERPAAPPPGFPQLDELMMDELEPIQ
jgi:hypothetical protein